MPAFNNAAASFAGDRHDHRACVEPRRAAARVDEDLDHRYGK